MAFEKPVVIFSLHEHPLFAPLASRLGALEGHYDTRQFPDGESYLKITTDVAGASCCVLADLSHPDGKYLPLVFLLDTLRELGAASVGLVAPYLCYMRQDRRFADGEAVTSRLFAHELSQHVDWLVTVDPHLHRYHSLNEIYPIANTVVQGAPALTAWIKSQEDVFLVGPDSESEQWVSEIAKVSGHPYLIGRKERYGDRQVEVSVENAGPYRHKTAIIIDDVISSGQTVLQCIKALKAQGVERIKCAAVHGIFSGQSDKALLAAGLSSLITTNTIPHVSNAVDISDFLVKPILAHMRAAVRRRAAQ